LSGLASSGSGTRSVTGSAGLKGGQEGGATASADADAADVDVDEDAAAAAGLVAPPLAPPFGLEADVELIAFLADDEVAACNRALGMALGC